MYRIVQRAIPCVSARAPPRSMIACCVAIGRGMSIRVYPRRILLVHASAGGSSASADSFVRATYRRIRFAVRAASSGSAILPKYFAKGMRVSELPQAQRSRGDATPAYAPRQPFQIMHAKDRGFPSRNTVCAFSSSPHRVARVPRRHLEPQNPLPQSPRSLPVEVSRAARKHRWRAPLARILRQKWRHHSRFRTSRIEHERIRCS